MENRKDKPLYKNIVRQFEKHRIPEVYRPKSLSDLSPSSGRLTSAPFNLGRAAVRVKDKMAL